MTDNSEKESPGSTNGEPERQPDTTSEEVSLREEAERYARLASERPADIHGEVRRIIELLRVVDPSEPSEATLKRRSAASTALLRLASDDSHSIEGCIAELVEELRAEATRESTADTARLQAVSQGIRGNLVATIAHVIEERPVTFAEIDDSSDYVDAITTELDSETLRAATKAFFASTSEIQHPVPVVEKLEELLAYPDSAVQAWSAGALGQLAEEDPDEVAPAADGLRSLLDHDDETVQHNVIEALATLGGTHPDVVAPAADTLRALLAHDDVAIQHNAAGVLGQLAKTHPDAVVPAVDQLQALCNHETQAVRRIATGVLARLAQEHPTGDFET